MFAAGDVKVTVAVERVLFAMKLRAARGRRDSPDGAVLAEAAGITTAAAAIDVYDMYYPHDPLKVAAKEWLAAHFAPGTS